MTMVEWVQKPSKQDRGQSDRLGFLCGCRWNRTVLSSLWCPHTPLIGTIWEAHGTERSWAVYGAHIIHYLGEIKTIWETDICMLCSAPNDYKPCTFQEYGLDIAPVWIRQVLNPSPYFLDGLFVSSTSSLQSLFRLKISDPRKNSRRTFASDDHGGVSATTFKARSRPVRSIRILMSE